MILTGISTEQMYMAIEQDGTAKVYLRNVDGPEPLAVFTPAQMEDLCYIFKMLLALPA